MNRLVLLLGLILTAPFLLSAQGVWPSADSEWYFDHENCFSPNILTHFEVTDTTAIQDIECTVLHQTTYSNWGGPFESENYLYFNGDTLFWWYEDAFYPLLCFNLEAGDTWNPLPEEHLNFDTTCTLSGMKVMDAYTININGETYRQLEIAPEIPYPDEWEDPWPSIVWGGTFNERTFGYGQFFPLYNICGAVVEWECYGFRCYNDSELIIEDTDGESCDHPLTVSLDEYALWSEHLIFPNPLKYGTPLQLSREANVRSIAIFTLLGQQVVQKGSDSAKSLNTSDLTPSQYIVRIELQKGKVVWEKLIVAP